MRDAIRDRSSYRQNSTLSRELKRTRFDQIKTLLGRDDSDKILLVRQHNHLIQPLKNDDFSRRRLWTHGAKTTFLAIACLSTGYAYARLQNDEVLRRHFYVKFANFITLFDRISPVIDSLVINSVNTIAKFD